MGNRSAKAMRDDHISANTTVIDGISSSDYMYSVSSDILVMTDSRHIPNPLRPYYVPPSIGTEIHAGSNVSSTTTAKSSTSFAFPDIDYSEYIPDASPSITGTLKTGLDKAVWKYGNVLMAQPFEVAKLILQVRMAQEDDSDMDMPATPNTRFRDAYEEADSEDEEPNYFTSSKPFSPSPSITSHRTPSRGRSTRSSQPSNERRPATLSQSVPEHLQMKDPHSLMEVLSSLSSSSGPVAVWKATNTTFIYTILHRTLETFLRSFLAAIIGIAESEPLLTTSSSLPDSTILNSTSPSTTVLVATAAAAISSLILAPIDTARTLQILLPSSSSKRNLLSTLRSLRPSWLIPMHLVPITFLTSSIPTLISTSTPLLLKNNLGLDPVVNPASWSIFTFVGSAIDLSVKFPLETVLRRAQIATWTSPTISPNCTKKSKRQTIETIVPVPTAYRGVLPTMWSIMRDEGYSESQKDRTAALMGKAPRRKRKGQGIEGLYRGWRVGLWGLVGVWGTAFVGGLQGDVAAGGTPIGGKF